MKQTINQALVNQFNGVYKGIGLLGLSSVSFFLMSLLVSDGSSSITSILSFTVSTILVIGSAGYFFSAVIDFETIEKYSINSNKRKPNWRDDEFLLLSHHKSIEAASVIMICFLFILWQLVGLEVSVDTSFTASQFCTLTIGLFMSSYSVLVWHQLKDEN